MADDIFDFGFTAVDEPDNQAPVPVQPSVDQDAILDKLAQLEAKVLNADNSGMINEHRSLVEADVASKLRRGSCPPATLQFTEKS
mgnify:CR=1 FL=1